jgi:hypothetical protein
MSAGVYGLTAERAYRTSSVYYFACPLGECAGGAYGHPHQQHLAIAGSIDIGDGISLYNHLGRRRIPT